MDCKEIELEMPGGYKKDVTVCRNVDMPPNIKGATNGDDLILISKYLDDLHVSDPDLYVMIHEANHIYYPRKSEYEIRVISDRDYYRLTGEKINTVDYLLTNEDYKKYADNLIREFD
jgi:hypothetical protein